MAYDEDEPVIAPDSDDTEQSSTTTTTTTTTHEPAKKGPHGPRPSIRPFRSNNDLLNALKRRQEAIKAGKKTTSYKPIIKDNALNANVDETADDENNKVIPSAPATPGPLPVKVERCKKQILYDAYACKTNINRTFVN